MLEAAREDIGALAEELGLEHGLLLKPSTLRLWAWRAATTNPADDAELLHGVLTEEGARRWQRNLVEPLLVDTVHAFRSGS